MALMTLEIEDIGNGAVRIQVRTDVDIDHSDITPAMQCMAMCLDMLADVHNMELETTEERVH